MCFCVFSFGLSGVKRTETSSRRTKSKSESVFPKIQVLGYMYRKNSFFLEAKLASWDVPSGIFIYFEIQKVELKNCSVRSWSQGHM